MAEIVGVSTQVATWEHGNPIVVRRGHGHRFVDNVIVHVDLDEGVRGSSYAWHGSERETRTPEPDSAASLIEATVRHLAPAVVGSDVFAYHRIWSAIATRTVHLGSGLVSVAHSAIDMAVWDAIGKLVEQPLHRLLGGARDSVPVYTTEMMEVWNRPLDEYVGRARELAAKGFAGLKLLYGTYPPQEDLERVRAVREAIGPDVGLMVDVAGRGWTLNDARWHCRRLEELDLTWIEDPLPLDDPKALARLCAETETAIATGERAFDLPTFRALFDAGGLDIAIFDPMRIGGVTGAVKLATIAENAGIPVAPHAFCDLGVNLMAAFPNGLIVEYLPWWGVLMAEPFAPVDGVGYPSERPGIGMDFDEAALERLRTVAPTAAPATFA